MESYQTLTVEGFDCDGEPEIRVYANGRIEVMFNFMPPSNGNPDGSSDPIFDDFEIVLADKLGVVVDREDRELFEIEHPTAQTASELKRFLEGFWQERGATVGDR
jgi:hypothetical protein